MTLPPFPRLIGIIVSGFVAGCTGLRSDWESPPTTMPAHWETTSGAGTLLTDNWWTHFGDPGLNALIDDVLRRNNDLAAAAIRVRRARLQAGLAATSVTPNVTVGVNAVTTKDIRADRRSTSYDASAALSYELDLWGRLSAARDAAEWEAQATEQDRQAATLSLVGTTATLYWQLAFLNEQSTTSEETVAYLDRVLSLVRVRFDAGAASRLDLLQAEQALVNQRAAKSQLEQSRTEARHALALLFDESPQYRVAELPRLPDSPLPEIGAGLPAELLGRRPDMRAAELRLREALANADQSRASFYPPITLTGSLGGTSTILAEVLRNPVASLGVGLTLPFIQWNTWQLTVQVSESRYEEAVVGFRQALYRALSEVEDALSARRRLADQAGLYERAKDVATRAEGLARVRYEAGKTGVQAWLDEQERQRKAVTALAQSRLNRLNNLIRLYQALGGDAALVTRVSTR